MESEDGNMIKAASRDDSAAEAASTTSEEQVKGKVHDSITKSDICE